MSNFGGFRLTDMVSRCLVTLGQEKVGLMCETKTKEVSGGLDFGLTGFHR